MSTIHVSLPNQGLKHPKDRVVYPPLKSKWQNGIGKNHVTLELFTKHKTAPFAPGVSVIR